MATRDRSRSGHAAAGRVQAVDLILEHRACQVAADRPRPRWSASGRSPAVDHEHREPLVREPLRRQVRARRRHHLLACRDRHTGRAAPAACRSPVRARWEAAMAARSVAFTERHQAHVERDRRRLRERLDRLRPAGRRGGPRHARRMLEVAGREHRRAACSARSPHTGSDALRDASARRRRRATTCTHRPRSGVVEARKTTTSPSTSRTSRTSRSAPVTDLVADDQSLGAVAIDGPDQRPVGQPRRARRRRCRPRRRRCPREAPMSRRSTCRPRGSAWCADRGSARRPATRAPTSPPWSRTRKRTRSHRTSTGRRSVDVDEMQRDVGVVGSRRRIRDRDRRVLRGWTDRRCTSDERAHTSTRATSRREPSGDHQ